MTLLLYVPECFYLRRRIISNFTYSSCLNYKSVSTFDICKDIKFLNHILTSHEEQTH